MHQDSIYRKLTESGSDNKAGYDYKSSTLIHKFVSPSLLSNPRLSTFIDKINDYLVMFLDLIKYYQFYNNFTIDKNDKRINI